MSDLKKAVHYQVGKICEEQEELLEAKVPTIFVAALTEVVFKQILSVGNDLEHFAKHRGKQTVSVDDVKLLCRRNPDLIIVAVPLDLGSLIPSIQKIVGPEVLDKITGIIPEVTKQFPIENIRQQLQAQPQVQQQQQVQVEQQQVQQQQQIVQNVNIDALNIEQELQNIPKVQNQLNLEEVVKNENVQNMLRRIPFFKFN